MLTELRRRPWFRPFRQLHLAIARSLRKLEGVLSSDSVWRTSIGAILCLQGLLIATHRPWLDKWQALMIAVQSPDSAALFANLRYEGHPAAWYALLRWIAEWLPDQRIALPLAAALLAAIGQIAILTASPFSRAERFLIATSEIFLFEFFTISRSITLGSVAVILAICIWPRKRAPWAFIALLPQCDFLFGVVSLAFVWLRYRERNLWWPGVVLWTLSGAFATWTVRPAAGLVKAIPPYDLFHAVSSWIARISTLGVPYQGNPLPLWNANPPSFVAPIGLALFGLTCLRETRARKDDAWVIWGMILITLAFSIVVYPLFARHLMVIALLLVALVWRRLLEGGSRPSPLFRTWLAIGAGFGLLTAAIGLAVPFDTADRAADRIRTLGLAKEHWLVFPDSRAESISALTGIMFERTETNCMQDFIRWNFRSRLETHDQLFNELDRIADREGRYYVLSDLNLPSRPGMLLPIARIPAGYDGYPYNIFVVRPELPSKHPQPLERCSGPGQPLASDEPQGH